MKKIFKKEIILVLFLAFAVLGVSGCVKEENDGEKQGQNEGKNKEKENLESAEEQRNNQENQEENGQKLENCSDIKKEEIDVSAWNTQKEDKFQFKYPSTWEVLGGDNNFEVCQLCQNDFGYRNCIKIFFSETPIDKQINKLSQLFYLDEIRDENFIPELNNITTYSFHVETGFENKWIFLIEDEKVVRFSYFSKKDEWEILKEIVKSFKF